MILPAIGFVISSLLFLAIAVIVRHVSRREAGVHPVGVFIACALVAAIAWSLLFRVIVADASGTLTSTASVIICLVGIPVCAAVAGWIGTRPFRRRRAQHVPFWGGANRMGANKEIKRTRPAMAALRQPSQLISVSGRQ